MTGGCAGVFAGRLIAAKSTLLDLRHREHLISSHGNVSTRRSLTVRRWDIVKLLSCWTWRRGGRSGRSTGDSVFHMLQFTCDHFIADAPPPQHVGLDFS